MFLFSPDFDVFIHTERETKIYASQCAWSNVLCAYRWSDVVDTYNTEAVPTVNEIFGILLGFSVSHAVAK